MSADLPLRNDHHVYILGAGYSAVRGMPLISNFLNSMRDAAIWFESNRMEREKNAIHEVLQFRLRAAASAYRVPIDLENVEELFSLASASDSAIAQSVKISIAATLWYCAQTKNPSYMYTGIDTARKQGWEAISKPYNDKDPSVVRVNLHDIMAQQLLLATQPKRSTVISFNYDTLVEESVELLKGTYNYGFKSAPNFEADVPYSDEGLKILKLHGSVNWSDEAEGFKIFKGYERLHAEGMTPLIIPPTWNKTIQDRLAEVWQSAIETLSTATKIFIVGFSIPKTDQHFKYLLAAGMKENFSLREIVFVDPAEALIRERCKDVIASREIENGRVRFVNAYLQDLMGKPLLSTPPIPGRYLPLEVGRKVFEAVLGS